VIQKTSPRPPRGPDSGNGDGLGITERPSGPLPCLEHSPRRRQSSAKASDEVSATGRLSGRH
jgi:hypothetical protein